MITRIILLIGIFSTSLFSQKQVKKSPTPSWVTPITYNVEAGINQEGDHLYLLLDFQDNLKVQDAYQHFVVKVLNAEGVQTYSDIEVSFDPNYQNLTFHTLNVYRNGSQIDHLANESLRTIQRESNMDRALYDGHLTTVINLLDIRPGDIIEYAYTKSGFNPIFKNNISKTYYQEYTQDIEYVFHKLLSKPSQDLFFNYRNNASKPKENIIGDQTEYIWDLGKVTEIHYDENTPSWIENDKFVEVSSYENWSDVVDWALPLYAADKNSVTSVLKTLPKRNNIEDRIVDIIRFVQDEVRYLGFEEGINGFKPHAPKTVLKQKFGDCKDKSLLLVTLLQNIGIEAYPMLVNSIYGFSLDKQQSSTLFNHCVASFTFENKEYYIDPTMNDQGGKLTNNYFPDYGYGLIIKKGNSELTQLETADYGSLHIDEIITNSSLDGSAIYSITSTYTGARADNIRSYFSSSTMNDMSKAYLDFYASVYPSIEKLENIEYIDTSRNYDNEVILKESYLITDFWYGNEEEATIYANLSPLVLSSEVSFPTTAKRTLPYYVTIPFQYSQKTKVILPESWTFPDGDKEIINDFFEYKSKSTLSSNVIDISYDFKIKTKTVEADEYSDFAAAINAVQNDLGYTLSYNKNLKNSGISFLSVFLWILAFVCGIGVCLWLYRRYDPEIKGKFLDKQIGGWMILPFLGLFFSFITISMQLFDPVFYEKTTWQAIHVLDFPKSFFFGLVITMEIFYNISILCFIVLLIVLFIKRRSSLPLLMVYYYIAVVLFPFLDIVFVQLLDVDALSRSEINSSYTDLLKIFIAAIIWGSYFSVSERVKETFTRRFAVEPSIAHFESDEE